MGYSSCVPRRALRIQFGPNLVTLLCECLSAWPFLATSACSPPPCSTASLVEVTQVAIARSQCEGWLPYPFSCCLDHDYSSVACFGETFLLLAIDLQKRATVSMRLAIAPGARAELPL